MKYRIHFELPDGTEDAIVVEGASADDIRDKATAELIKRGGRNPWSEELEA